MINFVYIFALMRRVIFSFVYNDIVIRHFQLDRQNFIILTNEIGILKHMALILA
jgi:hypothetical protein